jgi:hypothetical protein
VSPTTNTSYSITGTSAEGCLSASAAVSNVTVNALPLITVNNGTICLGQVFTMVPTGASSYTFSNGSNTASPSANTDYTVTGTSSEGCLSPVPAIASVTVYSLPVISVNSGSICSGQIFTIVPAGAITYTFANGSNTVSPVTTTNYAVTGTDQLGCVSASAAVSSITVHALPIVIISTSSQTICAGETAILTASGANTYSWSGGSTNDSLFVSPAVTSTFAVTGIDNNGCSNTNIITQNVDACAGINGEELSSMITVYPNPNNGEFFIETEEEMDLSVYTSVGQLILETHLYTGNNQINLGKYANGFYTLQVNGVQKTVRVKVVKQ